MHYPGHFIFRFFFLYSFACKCLFCIFDIFFCFAVGHHYIRNRNERQTVREDVKAAKKTYLEEVKNAQLLPDEDVHDM